MPTSRARLFVSAKTAAPVPYRSDVDRFALIRANLDGDIASIEPMDSVRSAYAVRGSLAVVSDALGVLRLLRLMDHFTAPLDAVGNLPVMEFTRSDILARQDVLGMIWGCRQRYIAPGDQVRILHLLAENGEAPLVDVASAACASADGVGVVLAMACRGLLTIDLDGPLSPETRIRRCRHTA